MGRKREMRDSDTLLAAIVFFVFMCGVFLGLCFV